MNRPIGMLTAGTDDLTGTADNDTFDAGLGQEGFVVGNTLSSADKIDGGAGNDTLDAVLSTESTVGNQTLNVQPTTRDVETINIEARSNASDGTPGAAGTVNLDAKNMVGVDTFGSDYSDGDLIIQNVNTLDGEGGIRNTGDITVRMDHTSNFDSIGDASDLTVLFDDDYLISGEETKDSLELRIVNNFELAENDSPLVDFDSVDFTVAGQKVSVDISGADTYQGVADAINNKLGELGIEGVKASPDDPRTSIFSDDLGGYEQGQLAGEYLPIDIVSTSGDLEAGTIKRASDVADFDGLNTWVAGDSQTTDDPVSVNVELEKVGRAGEGGNLVIGGKSQQIVDGQANGIQVFNIEVQGTDAQPSNLGTISSTNNTLETVNIVTDPSRLGSDDLADLTVRGEEAVFKTNDKGEFLDADGETTTNAAEFVVVDEASNPFGAANEVNASGFEGDLTIGTDYAAQNLGTLNATGGGDVNFTGTNFDGANHVVKTGGGNDEINVGLGNNADVDGAATSVTITTGGGNDVINLGGEGTATVEAGNGNDTVTGGGVSVTVDGGAGSDAIYVDNTGEQGAGVIDTSGLQQEDSAGNASYGFLFGRTVTVTVTVNGDQGINSEIAAAFQNGFEGTASVSADSDDNARLTTQDDLNNAVKDAVATSPALSDLVKVSVNTAGELEFTSKIDGENISVKVDIGKSTWSETDAETLLSEYQAANNDSSLTIQDEYASAGVNGSLTGGSDSVADNGNSVSLSGGRDTIVLSSTQEGAVDTIVVDEAFGTSSIVNFTQGEDQLDFSAYLDSMKSDSGSDESQVRIDTTYEGDDTLSANEVNVKTFAGNDDVASFNDLTAGNLLDVFDFDAEGYTNTDSSTQLVGGDGSSIVMVESDKNDGQYKVFDVSFDGTDEDFELSAGDVEMIGTADFGASLDVSAFEVA